MPSQYKEIPLTFEKGLVTEIEDSLLDVGQASLLTNWEPSANGALRSRNAWGSLSTTGLPSTYKVRGWGSIATGGSGAAQTGPTVVQTAKWPDGADADPVATKTLTLTGVTIGNVLVAVVCKNSTATPTVTAGWTERAVSTGSNQQVQFYTKVATGSTNEFTYTIANALIRSVTLYELANVPSADPGSQWAAVNHNAALGGTDSLTVNATDTDGGIAIIGYEYDAGTPATSDSGTAGMASSSRVNYNARTGVSIQDIDILDMQFASSGTTVSPAYTPPASGTLLMVAVGSTTTSWSVLVTANTMGLTWNNVAPFAGCGYSWADLSGGSTNGTVTVQFSGAGAYRAAVYFYYLSGSTDGSNPVQQVVQSSILSGDTNGPTMAALQAGSGAISIAVGYANGTWTSTDMMPDPATWGAGITRDDSGSFDDAGPVPYASAHINSTSTTQLKWANNTGYYMTINTFEIKGVGGAAQDRYGTFLSDGTVIENFTYVANKNLTAKMMVLGYTPVASVSTAIEFYIVLGLSTGTNTYSIYRILRDDITTGTWALIDSIDDAAGTDSWISFAQGAGKLVWTSTSMTAPRAITLSTLTAGAISDMLNNSGRTSAYHKDRMFIAGSENNPSRLWFSAIGDPTSFTTATDFLDIGGDDGEAIQGIVSVEGLLLVAKTNRAYLISGSGIETFFVNELAGGSAAPGQPVIRTPYGTILAGENDIWVVQGGGVDPMSRPLGDGYEIVGNVSSAYAQDCVLIGDSSTGAVWRVNLVTGAWAKEVVGTSNPMYNLFSLNGRLYYGTNLSTTEVGGTRRLSSSRSYDETTGGNAFEVATGKLALLGPSVKYTPRWLFLQLRSQDITKPNELTVTVETDQGSKPYSITVAETVQRERLDIGSMKGAEWIKVTLNAVSSTTAAAIDPERIVLGVEVEVPR